MHSGGQSQIANTSDEKKLFDVIARAYLAADARLPLPPDNRHARRARFRIPRFRPSAHRSRLARSFPGLEATRRRATRRDCCRRWATARRRNCHDPKIEDKETRPPPRYNEGTLIEAMHSRLYAAAVARRQADQIYNLSLTRTATVILGQGARRVIGVGRVKTPTLAIVCKRELEIQNFVPSPILKLSPPLKLRKASFRCGTRRRTELSGVRLLRT